MVTIDANPNVPYAVGQAVALVLDEQTGALVAEPCSCTYKAAQFYGFLNAPAVVGNPPVIMVGRGSLVTPLVENDALLVPEGPIWLSGTPGRVTQTCPVVGWTVQIGHALTTTKMVLLTDAKFAS